MYYYAATQENRYFEARTLELLKASILLHYAQNKIDLPWIKVVGYHSCSKDFDFADYAVDQFNEDLGNCYSLDVVMMNHNSNVSSHMCNILLESLIDLSQTQRELVYNKMAKEINDCSDIYFVKRRNENA
jgi:hypothetical protein